MVTIFLFLLNVAFRDFQKYQKSYQLQGINPTMYSPFSGCTDSGGVL